MPVLLRGCLAITALIGALFLTTVMAWGSALCDGCDAGITDRVRLFILLMLVAVAGLVWTLTRNRPHVVRNAAIWFGAVLLFGLGLPMLDYSLR